MSISIHQTILADGSLRIFEWKDRAIFNASNEIVEYQGIGRDVTAQESYLRELEQTKRELEEQQTYINNILSSMQDALMSIRLIDRKYIYSSSSVERVFGYPIDAFQADPQVFTKITPANALPAVIEAQQKCLQDGYAEIEHPIIFPDGSTHWLHRRAWVSYDADGKPLLINDSASDITERKLAQDALVDSEEQYRTILENITDAVFVTNDAGEFQFISPNASIIFGYSSSEIADMPNISQILGESIFNLAELGQDETLSNIQREITDKFGGKHLLLITVKRVQLKIGTILYTCRDITERVQAETTIRFQADLLHQVSDAIISTDLNLRISSWNHAATEIYGWTSEEALGQVLDDLLQTEWEDMSQSESQAMLLQSGHWAGAIKQRTKDKGIVHVMASVNFLRNQQGDIVGGITINRDISILREQEAELRFHSEVLHRMSEGVHIVGHDARILYTNPTFEKMFGYKAGELLGQSPAILNAPDTETPQDVMENILKDLMEQGEWHGEVFNIRKDGRRFWTRASISGFEHQEFGHVWITVQQDISAEKAAQAARERSDAIFQAFVNSVPGTIFILDAQNNLRFANPQYAASFGQEVGAILGKPMRDYGGEELARVAQQENEHVLRTNTSADFNYTSNSGEKPIYWHITKFPIPQPVGEPLIGAIALDVSTEHEAEVALKESSDWMRLALEATGLGKWQHDIESDICRFDEQARLHYGLEQESLPSDEVIRQIHPEDLPQLAKDIANTIAGKAGRRFSTEYRVVHPDGSVHWVSVHARINFEDVDGQNIARFGFGTIQDITDRKQAQVALQASEKRYRQMFELHGLPKLIIEPDTGQLIDANPAAAAYYGYSVEDLKKLTIFDINLSAPTLVREKMAQASEASMLSCQFLHKGADQKAHDVEIFTGPVEIDGKNYLYSIVTDISEKERAKAALVQLNQSLEERILERTSALAHAKQRIEAIFHSSADGLIYYDSKTGIQQVNRRFEQLIGVTELDCIGKDLQAVIASKHWQTLNIALEKLRESAEIQEIQVSVERNDGSQFDAELGFALLIDRPTEDGSISYEIKAQKSQQIRDSHSFVCSIRDISERKRAEIALRESEEKFRLFVESAPIATVITDKNGEIALVNKAAEKLFGYTREELVHKQIETLVPEQLREKHIQMRDDNLKQDTFITDAQELLALHKDSSTFPVEIQLSLIETPMQEMIMSFIIDIRQRKEAENALKQSLAKERELGELKTRFVSMASHEFRTPLASILATTETISIYRGKLSELQIEQRLSKITQQVIHMKQLIDDMLQLARFEAGRVNFNPSQDDLDALCQDILEEFEIQAEYRGRFDYKVEIENTICDFDNRLMRQLISNVVSNALKYSQKVVSIRLTKENTEICLQVKDEGIGIPDEDMKHLFEPFHRANNVGTISGTGLGLGISKHAIEAHGGRIELKTKLNMGTDIRIFLPLQNDKD
jgi:PAS domain S-box-containing protein